LPAGEAQPGAEVRAFFSHDHPHPVGLAGQVQHDSRHISQRLYIVMAKPLTLGRPTRARCAISQPTARYIDG
jgi:hypothetical protein